MAFLKKRPRKNGFVYYIYFNYNGKKHGKSTGTDDKKTAQMILKEIEAKLAKNTFKLEDITPQKSVYLKDFAVEYLEYSKSRKAVKTFNSDRLSLRKFIEFTGNITITSVTPKLIDKYLIKRVEEVKTSSVNVEIRHLKAAFSSAVKWDHIKKNPFIGIKQFSTPKNKAIFFTDKEISALIDVIEESWLIDIVIFAVNTGLRIGELVNLKWVDIDFNKKHIMVKNSNTFTTKNKLERKVPLNQEARNLLLTLPHLSEYAFPNGNGKIRDRVFVSRRFKRYIRLLKLNEEFTFHSLRHTFASHLVRNGISLYQVAKIMGHTNSKTTELYAHLAPDDLQDAVDTLTFGRSQVTKRLGLIRGNNEANATEFDDSLSIAAVGQ